MKQLPQGVPSDFTSLLPSLAADHLRRTQLLIHPLVAHLSISILPDQPTTGSVSAKVDRNAALLRFGPPSGSAASASNDFRSPLAVAKPGKRFGLLSIVV